MTPVLLLDAAWRIDRVIGDEYACELLVTGRALPASEDIARVFHSPSIEVAVPTVIARVGSDPSLRRRRDPVCTPRRVRIRDGHVCQFVIDGRPCDRHGDSVDHLVPRSQGGPSSWTNLTTACRPHNGLKRDRTFEEMRHRHGWDLRRTPSMPTREAVILGDVRRVQPGWAPFLGAPLLGALAERAAPGR